jgi:hypothetical protein
MLLAPELTCEQAVETPERLEALRDIRRQELADDPLPRWLRRPRGRTKPSGSGNGSVESRSERTTASVDDR